MALKSTQEFLAKKYIYEPESGLLFHKNPTRKHLVNKPVGTKTSHGYLVANIGGTKNKLEYVHRIAWILTNGDIPKGKQIDHIDRNRQNNKISNLRVVEPVLNRDNSSLRNNNKTGVTGVHWGRHINKWVAQIRPYKQKTIHLGCFDSFEEAVQARKVAEKMFHSLKIKDVVDGE